jgi:hypothetical protein
LPQIARELNVDAIVEGSVVRSGNQIRITAQLVQVPADKHLWAQSYEGNARDILTLQRQIASAIAEQIRIELTPQQQTLLKTAHIVNPDAYEVVASSMTRLSRHCKVWRHECQTPNSAAQRCGWLQISSHSRCAQNALRLTVLDFSYFILL